MYSGLRKEDLVAKYFSMLDDDDIIALYNIYYDDFQMFGYQFEFRGLKLNPTQANWCLGQNKVKIEG